MAKLDNHTMTAVFDSIADITSETKNAPIPGPIKECYLSMAEQVKHRLILLVDMDKREEEELDDVPF